MCNALPRGIWILWLLIGLLALGPVVSVLAAPPAQSPNPLTALEAASSEPVTVAYSAGTGAADFVSGAFATRGATPDARARAFLQQHGQLFGVRDPQAELSVMRTVGDDLGMSHIVYEQRHRGVPVFGARLAVHMDQVGRVTAVNGQFQPDIALDEVTPVISGAEAQALVQAQLRAARIDWQQAPRLVIWTHNQGGTGARLVWEVLGFTTAPLGRWHYFIDAQTGEVVYRLNELHTAGKNRATFTANNTTLLPGVPVCSEANPSGCDGDAVAKAAHDYAGLVYDYFLNTFGRDSYDDNGAPLVSTVHYDYNYNNAFWNGVQMVYGDGDGNLFSPLAQDLDVVAHELAHAVTQETSGLFYEGQSGALNESYSDVFAVFVNPGNWQIGEGAYTPGIPGDALRNVQDPTNGGQWNPDNPGAGGQPDHMAVIAVLPTALDQGGVHINSGIPNKAAYLITAGGTFRGISVTGIGQTKAEQIYYRTQALYNTPFTDFANAANNTFRACQDLVQAGSYGIAAADCNSVRDGWAAVGVGASSSQVYHTFLPIMQRAYPNPTPGIYGQVTVAGAPAAGQELALYRCVSSGSCIRMSATSTDGGGNYRFDVPTLPANYYYVVYYAQEPLAATCNLWSSWQGNWITQFTAGESRSGGDFDLAPIGLVAPKGTVSGSSQTFQWSARTLPSGMLQDFPRLQIYTTDWSTLLYQSSTLARGTTSTTVNGFSGGNSYNWVVLAYGPGGVGIPACGARIDVSSAAAGGPEGEAELVPLPQQGSEAYPETLDLWRP